MSQSASGEALDRIVQREVSKVARNSTVLYVLNAIAVIVGARVISAIFRGFSYPGQFETFVDGLLSIIALYAVVVFFWTRSRLSRGIGIHFYALGVLGLIGGALLFAFGGVQFLGTGYWVRQFKGEGTPKCARDGGSVVVYGEDSLVCIRCSKLVRIQFDLPRKWTYAGLVMVLAGIAWLFLVSVAPGVASLTSPVSVGYVLLIDGISFLGTWLAQFTYLGGGNVRLPPGVGEAGTSGVRSPQAGLL